MLGTLKFILISIEVFILFIAPCHITVLARLLSEEIGTFRKEMQDMRTKFSEQPILVFVSSTMNDLSEERRAIHNAIGQIAITKPWLFEFTPASSDNIEDSYLNKVRECDIFILIIGETISQPVIREFELAKEIGKPCLIFLKECTQNEETRSFIEGIKFKWEKFSSPQELRNSVRHAIIDELIKGYRKGSLKKLGAEHFTLLLSIQQLFERPRKEITIYTVQDGDTVFSIAEKFGLQPQTILWGNYTILLDDPHKLKPGQELNILPVDGVYYPWRGGISFGDWAEFFGVTAADIIDFPGNHIDPNTVGDYNNANIEIDTWLIIPNGKREFMDWSKLL